MGGSDLRAYLKAIKCTQKSFAQVMGVNPHAVKDWIAGRHRIPGPVIAYVDLDRKYRWLKAIREHKSKEGGE